jgi:putative tryptophan/tyrosine transport system substrate-binding protein
MINRHGFLIWLALSLLALPHASAQTGTRLARIGWLRSDAGQSLDDELRRALRELGWVEGRNLSIEVTRDGEFDVAVARAKGGALLVVGDAMFSRQRTRIAELCIKHRVPVIFVSREDVLAGGLMSFNTSSVWHIRQAAGYVDKILNGAKPGDLPVQQPTHWELAINLKTAKALGLTIPKSLMLRADEVVE